MESPVDVANFTNPRGLVRPNLTLSELTDIYHVSPTTTWEKAKDLKATSVYSKTDVNGKSSKKSKSVSKFDSFCSKVEGILEERLGSFSSRMSAGFESVNAKLISLSGRVSDLEAGAFQGFSESPGISASRLKSLKT